MPNINYELRQKIIAQALQEIMFARNYKQGKVRNWKINEDLYYGRKIATEAAVSNVDLSEMQGHVHTVMSKVDEALVFKYTKRKKAQLKRVNRLNALRIYDQDRDFWDLKDIAVKKQAVIYGRGIFAYYADSVNEYTPHLEPIDVYDFLIDPSAGGLFLEKAKYLGDYGITYTKEEIEQGIKDKIFLKTEGQKLIAGPGNAETWNQEETNKINRTRDTNVWQVNKYITGNNQYKFWRWGTTYAGKRYYLLISERGGQALEVAEIKDRFASGLWWYWSYAAFPDLTEFWTPSFCDYVREIIMAKAVTINQMIDNGEMINKPQRKVQVGAIENMAELKYRRNGLIKVKKDIDINKAYQVVETPALTAPLMVFDKLDMIQQRSSGVTAGDAGSAANNSGSKATIYAGNQANSADRFGYFNKSYSFGYKSFAILYENGVREHLIRKVSIDILGPDGVELEEVSRRDIFWKNDKFNITTESSRAEMELSEDAKKAKLAFLAAHDANPNTVQNAKKSYEMQASIAGFSDEEIRQLMDTSEFGNEELMSDADRDLEMILDGKNIPPNQEATTAYMQRFVDYMTKNQATGLTDDEFERISKYVDSLGPIITRNMVKMANATLAAEAMKMATSPEGAAALLGKGEQPQPKTEVLPGGPPDAGAIADNGGGTL